MAGDPSSEFGQIIGSLKKNIEFGKWEELNPQHEITYCDDIFKKYL